ncbi:hypothetical protein C6A85_85965 [Mycobacterium sp. ITM-2017-0098]|nr:hypothetical protein C6A85_85965 [Mycobacterium sp. ITM-2017-0098]
MVRRFLSSRSRSSWRGRTRTPVRPIDACPLQFPPARSSRGRPRPNRPRRLQLGGRQVVGAVLGGVVREIQVQFIELFAR